MDGIYKNIEKYSPNEKQKILIVFDMIADMLGNKKFNPIVIELFIKSRKLNTSIVFTTQSYFAVLKFIMKIANKSFNKSHLLIHQI